jgi:hypothetical protein
MQRRPEVIGDALRAEVVQHRVIHLAVRIGKPASQRFAGIGDVHHRAFEEGPLLEQFEAAVADLGAGFRMPPETASDDLRM